MHERSAWFRYTLATTSTVAALVLDYLVPPLGPSPPLLLFAAITFSAWAGGLGPGLLATVLGAFGVEIFLITPFAPITDEGSIIRLCMFMVMGGVVSTMVASLRGARSRALAELTERRRAEDTIREMNRDLDRRVRERTALLQEALDEMEAFSHTIAHDLRAPMRAVRGFAEVLGEEAGGRLEPAENQYLQRIVDAARRMDDLVLGLLAYSRLSRAPLPLERVPVTNATAPLRRRLEREVTERGGRLTVAFDPALPALRAHPGVLAEVLASLASNAVKFVGPGVPPEIRMGAGRREDCVRVWIEDNGIGIDPRYHERIFGVFERVHRDDRYPGAGVGLAFVRKAMARMGGSVGVESAAGQGSRFWIELPIAHPEDATDDPPDPPVPQDRTQAAPPRRAAADPPLAMPAERPLLGAHAALRRDAG